MLCEKLSHTAFDVHGIIGIELLQCSTAEPGYVHLASISWLLIYPKRLTRLVSDSFILREKYY
jgi:hypothetical protein